MERCGPHTGQLVRVGDHKVWAGGFQLSSKCLASVDLLISLGRQMPGEVGEICTTPVLWLPLKDFGGVPDNWRELLERRIIPKLERFTPAIFCYAGHGRTGTLLASLVALLESPEQTPDPIAAVRQRYCEGAVETRSQAEAIFALRGQKLPRQYEQEFPEQRRVRK